MKRANVKSKKLSQLLVVFCTVTSCLSALAARGDDICGSLNLEQCRRATRLAIEAREQAAITGENLFEVGYIDPANQLAWAKKALPENYTNGCMDINDKYFDKSNCKTEIGSDGDTHVVIEDSKAAKACRALGGGARLPTRKDLESMLRSFDHVERNGIPYLTRKGIADMEAVFGDMRLNRWFWTSTVNSKNPDIALFFNGTMGYMATIQRSPYPYGLATWCVSKQQSVSQ